MSAIGGLIFNMNISETITDLLPYVSKPIQYVGEELNAVHKPWHEVAVKVGLCFPDLYEVGMAHLGLHLLYQIVNARKNALAERIYAPAVDLETLMRAQRIPLFSLESHRAAAEFDLLGFTLQYELSYSNVLNMLTLAGIPVMAAERRLTDPFVMAGGPCACNPEPLAEVLDLVVLGDSETVIGQITDLYDEWKRSGSQARQEFLRQVSRLRGVYVPAFYDVRYDATGLVVAITPNQPGVPEYIERYVEPDLDTTPYVTAPVIPFLKLVHDRITLEIMRGCPRGCRFCQAGFIYRPQRERSVDYLMGVAQTLLAQTGYEEISLASLSTGDYSRIEDLLRVLMQTCEMSKVSVSLPSLRITTLTEAMAAIISRVRKTGFTLAPEAGTQRLRDVINKGIQDADILHTAEEAFKSGWDLLKLYFMIGLPTETADDLEGLADLVYRIRNLGNRLVKRKVNLNVAISSFVPKAHTPFQWERMASSAELQHKQETLQARIRHRAIQLKWHDAEASFLEGVFARGDRRLGGVLRAAQRLGCRFDGWNEHFNFAQWMQAFAQQGIDPANYVARERSAQEVLPWEHLHSGVSSAYLWQERLNALRGEVTAPCDRACRQCGVCGEDLQVVAATPAPDVPRADAGVPTALAAPPLFRPKAFRMRAIYTKTGMLRFLSHLDLNRLFQRAVARLQLPIAFSQGFHPHPHIAFGPALPVGAEGLREQVDFFLTEPCEAHAFRQQLNATLPTGIALVDAYPVGLKEPSLSALFTRFSYAIGIPTILVEQGYTEAYFTPYVEAFHAQLVYFGQKGQARTDIAIDLKPLVAALAVTRDAADLPRLEMTLVKSGERIVKPEDILHQVCQLPYEKILAVRIVRLAMESECGEPPQVSNTTVEAGKSDA